MLDRYHATFLSYVDFFQCDKRVHHYFSISKSKEPPILRATSTSYKTASYTELLADLTSK